MIWLIITHRSYIIKTTSFDWLLFLFFHIKTVRDFQISSCVLCARSKTRIKMFWMVMRFSSYEKYERNCYLWSVKWKSILRTFVGIVVSGEETKALMTNLQQVNIAPFKRLSTWKRLPLSLPANVTPTPCSNQPSHSQEQSTKRAALEDLRCGHTEENISS